MAETSSRSSWRSWHHALLLTLAAPVSGSQVILGMSGTKFLVQAWVPPFIRHSVPLSALSLGFHICDGGVVSFRRMSRPVREPLQQVTASNRDVLWDSFKLHQVGHLL